MNRRFITSCLTGAMILLAGGLAMAQVEVQKDLTDENLWTDAVYYLKIGRMEYGKAYLQAYIDRKVDPVKTLEFSEKDPRAVQILTRLECDPQMGSLARAALDQIDKGWQLRRRDVSRVQSEIDRLAGTPRAQFQAIERLRETGEYAVPVILDYLGNEKYASLQPKLIEALVALGPNALEPLLAALPYLPDRPKLLVIDALSRLDYSQSLPYLKTFVENPKTSAPVRAAATRAIEAIITRNPRYQSRANAAEAFYQLALRYYERDSAVRPGSDTVRVAGLAPDVTAEQPNLWLWKDGKLVPQQVPWEIYYELMTMRTTRRSLELDNNTGHRRALTLWLMANTDRASKLSDKVVDPIHSNDFPDVQYFFRTAGTTYGLDALNQALKYDDVVVALAALEALREVAGNDILATIDNAQPIVSALNHRHQLIRLYAALALGWAAPCDKYPGMDDVVPVLGNAINNSKNPTLVVIVPNNTRRAAVSALAQKLGYAPSDFEAFDAANTFLAKCAADVELIVLDYSLKTPSADQAIKQIRSNPLLKLVPIVITVAPDRLADAQTVIGRKPGIAIDYSHQCPVTGRSRNGTEKTIRASNPDAKAD